MSTNKFKVKGQSNGSSLFSKIESILKIDSVFEEGLPVRFLPYILYVMAVGIFYIGNTHYAEKNIRLIDKMNTEVEDLRADYTTLKADYMFAGKQSEVARKVKAMELEESLEPPKKILITKD